jgi:hypothetical protein
MKSFGARRFTVARMEIGKRDVAGMSGPDGWEIPGPLAQVED